MTREEAKILGDDPGSLRDAMMKLLGAFEQHVQNEDAWQQRIEEKLDAMPTLMDAKVAACRSDREDETSEAVEYVDKAIKREEFHSDQSKFVAWAVGIAGGVTAIILGIIRFIYD